MPMRWEFLRHIPKKKLILALGDGFLILVTLATVTAFSRQSSSPVGLVPPLRTSLFVCGVYLFCFYIGNLYVPLSASHQRSKLYSRLIVSVLGALVLLVVFSQVFPSLTWGVLEQVLFAFLIIPCASGWRWAFDRAFSRFMQPMRVLVVGAGWAGSTIASVLASKREFHLIGYVDDGLGKGAKETRSVPVLGHSSDILAISERYRPTLIVLAITHDKRDTLFRSLLECKMKGIELCDMPSLYEELTGKVPVKHVRDSWFVYSSLRGVRKTVYAARLKRVLDVVLALTGLILSCPISVLTAVAIGLESGSPILYRQRRVGQNEQEFWLVKFRSMRRDAEAGTGVVWAKPGDDRVTKVGRLIRGLRIDEIPQMWNVLKGEMSFIGPRPERPEFVKELKGKIPYYSLRHTIKPGITGWAQVNYGYGASEEDALEKLQYDLYYLKNMSALLDLHILLRTIRVVLFRQGSR